MQRIGDKASESYLLFHFRSEYDFLWIDFTIMTSGVQIELGHWDGFRIFVPWTLRPFSLEDGIFIDYALFRDYASLLVLCHVDLIAMGDNVFQLLGKQLNQPSYESLTLWGKRH